jgi:hypothetical protein
MSFELERLEERLALSPAVPGSPETAATPAPALVSPAENEALLDPLMTRLGPRPEAAPLFPAAPVRPADRVAAPDAAPLDPAEELEVDEPLGDPENLSLLDAAPPPTEETSDRIMSEPGDLFDDASPAQQEG